MENGKRARGERDGWAEGRSDDEVERLGDRRPDFVYTL